MDSRTQIGKTTTRTTLIGTMLVLLCWRIVGTCSPVGIPECVNIRAKFESNFLHSATEGRVGDELAEDCVMRLKGGKAEFWMQLKQTVIVACEAGKNVFGMVRMNMRQIKGGNAELGFIHVGFIPPFLRKVCKPQTSQSPLPLIEDKETSKEGKNQGAICPDLDFCTDKASDRAVDSALDQAILFAESPHLDALMESKTGSDRIDSALPSSWSNEKAWAAFPKPIRIIRVQRTSFERKPGMSDLQFELLKKAAFMKHKGNLLHKKGMYKEAVAQYDGAKKVLKDARKAFVIDGGESEEYIRMMMACSLNLASCCIATGNFFGAVRYCSEVLENEKENYKALYRRGVAYQHIATVSDLGPHKKEFNELAKTLHVSNQDLDKCRKRILELALEDVLQAHELVRGDKSIEKTLENLRAQILAAGGSALTKALPLSSDMPSSSIDQHAFSLNTSSTL